MKQSWVNVAFICDSGYVIPTVVAMHSLILNKNINTNYHIHLIETDLDQSAITLFKELECDDVRIHIVHASVDSLKKLHTFDSHSHCVATVAALLKFYLPTLLPECEKVLYLDGDILVLKDLFDLYSYDFSLNHELACAVIDSGSIYYKHKYVQQVQHYFNSGVMLLNLARMRNESISEVLVQKKQELNDSSLMDQNVFNLVFDGQVHLLSIQYNVLLVNLIRAKKKYKLEDINVTYGSNYSSLGEIIEFASIVHFSSKDKPWKYQDVPWADEWYHYFQGSPVGDKVLERKCLEDENLQNEVAGEHGTSRLKGHTPKVSIVMPVYNVESYLEESLQSILSQTFQDIEIICVNDGSTDRSEAILKSIAKKDLRVIVINQSNQGQSAARNVGVKTAHGKYIYFMDSDDKLEENAIEILYREAEKEELDLLLFDGTSFYETSELEKQFPQYKTYYKRTYKYKKVRLGCDLYVEMVRNGDFKVSPCLQFFNRDFLLRNNICYKNGIIHEDNLFAFISILQANRAAHIPDVLFIRRVHESSTMTTEVGFKNFKGYFICAILMMQFLSNRSFKSAVVLAASQQISSYIKTARNIYMQLTRKERAEIHDLSEVEKLYFQKLVQDAINPTAYVERNSGNTEAIYQELQFYKKELENVKKSFSFRIGRFITFIPRKIRGTIRCYREHGLMYTLHCIFYGSP